jgi:hypothetical protein
LPGAAHEVTRQYDLHTLGLSQLHDLSSFADAVLLHSTVFSIFAVGSMSKIVPLKIAMSDLIFLFHLVVSKRNNPTKWELLILIEY